jgi:hypothetical protein
MKEVARANGGMVNDVLLAAVAGGTRRLLRRRGDRVDGVVAHLAFRSGGAHPACARRNRSLTGLSGSAMDVSVPDRRRVVGSPNDTAPRVRSPSPMGRRSRLADAE